jgi:hypothetical protein
LVDYASSRSQEGLARGVVARSLEALVEIAEERGAGVVPIEA